MIEVYSYQGDGDDVARFVIGGVEDAIALRDLFTSMSTGVTRAFDLVSSDRFLVHDVTRFVCQTVTRAQPSPLRKTPAGTVEWCATIDEWEDCAGLMDGLIAGGSGHQYLARNVSGEAVVIVSLKETRWPRPSVSNG